MRRRPPARLRPVAWLGALAVAMVVAAVVAAVLGSPPTVLPAAAPGTVRVDSLADGRPVLVHTTADGRPVVLDPRRSIGGGWVGIAGWCGRADFVLDRLSGRQWTPEGHPRLPAGPGRARETAGTVAPALARYDLDVDDDQLRVGSLQPPDPEAPVTEVRRFRLCPGDEVATPPLPGDAIELIELSEADDGWHRVEATLDVAATPPRLCSPTATPPCDGPALPPLPDSARPLVAAGLRGTVAIRLREGRVNGVGVPANVREVP